ncbi:MAG: NAD(P)/FAD-dependent oxidoreductase [Thermoplasmatales archaeon]|nr:NAD(P)/FAD-dependent oxidoreductase [Thermoplasmatales archaeon]MCK5261771.1 NAD(P)/FAD-dependent oxidoreductase [Thermoplasmatales archaeon]
MKYDVVVVGSGPAGSVTARFAAESGANVLIIERRQEVGVPVLCGEGVSKGVDEFKVLEGKRWLANNMDGARIISPDGTMVKLAADMAGDETGYVLYRDIFDQELARGAIRAGAELMLNTCAVNILKENGKINGVKAKQFGEEFDIEADIVVGADGVESKIGRWAGMKTTLKPYDLETCAQYTLSNVEFDRAYCDFYLGKKIAPGGYAWIFPKGKDIANVGIGILASLSEPGMSLKLLDKFINSRPELKKGEPLRFLAGAVPVAEPIESVRDNLLLVGDAARQVDPITGGGLMASIEAGKTAGETIGKAIDEQRFDKEMLLPYEEKLKNTLYKKLKRNYVVKEIILGMEDKTLNMLADSLKDYKFDELSTLSLVKALVLKHPSLLIKLKPLLKLSRL